MKTKITLLLLCFCSFLFSGFFKKKSVYGTYSNHSEISPKWTVVEITEPNFFTYKTIKKVGDKSVEIRKHQGVYVNFGESLFLLTDRENNRGYTIYLTDKTFNKV